MCLLVEVVFAMFFEMVEVRFDGVGSSFDDVFHDLAFVIGFSFAFFDGYCVFGAVSNAGAEAVAKEVVDEACFVVDDLEGAFGAVGYALSAAGAFFFVDGDDFSFCHKDPFLYLFDTRYIMYSKVFIVDSF